MIEGAPNSIAILDGQPSADLHPRCTPDGSEHLDFKPTYRPDRALAGRAPKQTGARKLKALHWNEIDVLLEGRYLVKGALPASGVSVAFGHSGTGKSFLVLDQALHVALGWEWFGRRVTQAGVVYVAAEGGEGLRNRIAAFRHHHGVSGRDAIPFVLIPEVVDLFQNDVTALVEAIENEAQRIPIPVGLIVIDTVSKTMGGGKENTDDLATYVANCERIARTLVSTVLLVHHRPKDNENRSLRGHSSFGAGVDSSLIVEQDTAGRTAESLKMKDGEDGWRLGFDLKVIELGKDRDGDPVTSCVVIPKDAPAPKRSEVKLSDRQAIALRALRTAFAPSQSSPTRGDFERAFRFEEAKAVLIGAGIGDTRLADITEVRGSLARKGLLTVKDGLITITQAGWDARI